MFARSVSIRLKPNSVALDRTSDHRKRATISTIPLVRSTCDPVHLAPVP